MEKYLTHRGIDMWLTDSNDQNISHISDSVNDNTILATVSIKRGALYTVNWKCSSNSPPFSAFWEAFVSSKTQSSRIKGDDQIPRGVVIARHFIDERDPQSQAHSSTKHRLFPPYKRDGHLQAPLSATRDAYLGFVRLEFRRTQGDIAFWEKSVPGKPGDHDCTIEADVVDDKNEGKAPYIIFQFNFVDALAAPAQHNQASAKRLPPAELSAPSPKHESAKRPRVQVSSGAESCHASNTVHGPRKGLSTLPRSTVGPTSGQRKQKPSTRSSKVPSQVESSSSTISGPSTPLSGTPTQPGATSPASQTRPNLSARFATSFPETTSAAPLPSQTGRQGSSGSPSSSTQLPRGQSGPGSSSNHTNSQPPIDSSDMSTESTVPRSDPGSSSSLTKPLPPTQAANGALNRPTNTGPSKSMVVEEPPKTPLPPLAKLRQQSEEKSAEIEALEEEVAEREAMQKEVALMEAKILSLRRRLGTV